MIEFIRNCEPYLWLMLQIQVNYIPFQADCSNFHKVILEFAEGILKRAQGLIVPSSAPEIRKEDW